MNNAKLTDSKPDIGTEEPNRYHVPMPSQSDSNAWERDEYLGRSYLTNAGIHEIEKLIREKQKWRQDRWVGWLGLLVSVLVALLGLVGTLRERSFPSKGNGDFGHNLRWARRQDAEAISKEDRLVDVVRDKDGCRLLVGPVFTQAEPERARD